MADVTETCGWRRDETFLPCGLPPGHDGGHRPAIPKPTTCGWCWGTHGCLDLPAGHDGDHECRMPVCDDDGNEVGYEVCDTLPQGDLDLFHMHWGEGRSIEYLDPVKQAESDRIYARMRFIETPAAAEPARRREDSPSGPQEPPGAPQTTEEDTHDLRP